MSKKQSKMGSSVLSKGGSMQPPKFNMQTQSEDSYKVLRDGKIQVRSSKYKLKTGDQIAITIDDKTVVVEIPGPPGYLKIPGLEKYEGKRINLQQKTDNSFSIIESSVVHVPKIAPKIAPGSVDEPPTLTSAGKSQAKKQMKRTNWEEIKTISQANAGIMPSLLTDYYEYDRMMDQKNKPTVLLLGPPGIGKSVGIRDSAIRIARKQGLNFVDYSDEIGRNIVSGKLDPSQHFVYVDLRLTELEPQDLAGLPHSVQTGGTSYMEYLNPLWAQTLNKCSGVLLLDELTNVQRPDILSASYKIALERKVGFMKFHPEVMVIAAGNRPEDSGIANDLPAPLMDRVLKVSVDIPSLQDWSKWMTSKYEDGWDRTTLAYLMFMQRQDGSNREFLNPPTEGLTLENFPTPRSWTRVGVMLPQITPENAELLMRGYLGDATGAKFLSFIKNKPPSTQSLIDNPSLWEGLNLNTKFLSLVGLSNAFKNAAEKDEIKKLKKQLPLINTIGKDDPELLAAVTTMIGRSTALKALLVMSKEGDKGINILLDSFKSWTDMKKLVGEMTQR